MVPNLASWAHPSVSGTSVIRVPIFVRSMKNHIPPTWFLLFFFLIFILNTHLLWYLISYFFFKSADFLPQNNLKQKLCTPLYAENQLFYTKQKVTIKVNTLKTQQCHQTLTGFHHLPKSVKKPPTLPVCEKGKLWSAREVLKTSWQPY